MRGGVAVLWASYDRDRHRTVRSADREKADGRMLVHAGPEEDDHDRSAHWSPRPVGRSRSRDPILYARPSDEGEVVRYPVSLLPTDGRGTANRGLDAAPKAARRSIVVLTGPLPRSARHDVSATVSPPALCRTCIAAVGRPQVPDG
ncbi:hypothetical protein GCM10009736_01200 [Actinomadura bangladeshensis]